MFPLSEMNFVFPFRRHAELAKHLARCYSAPAAIVPVGTEVSKDDAGGKSSRSPKHFPRVHVGLADDASYQRIDVQWPGGSREVFPGGKANQIVVLTEGKSSPAPAPKH